MHRANKSRLRNRIKVTTLESLLRMVMLAPREIDEWLGQFGPASVEVSNSTGLSSDQALPLLKRFRGAFIPTAYDLPDVDDVLGSECESDGDDEGFGPIDEAVVLVEAEVESDGMGDL